MPAPLVDPLGGADFAHGAEEVGPGANLAVVSDCLAAVGIVELENRGLGEGVASAEGGGVLGVALQLGGPSLVAFGQESAGHPVQSGSSSEEQGAAGDDLFRLPDVRHDVLGGLAGAGAEAGEGQRSAHELEEVAAAFDAVFVVAPADGLLREFARQELLEFGGGGEIVEAAPIVAAAGAFQPRANGGQV